MTTDYDSVDYFTDQSLVPDPHPYYDHIREKDPVCCPVKTACLRSPAGNRPTPFALHAVWPAKRATVCLTLRSNKYP